MSTLDQRIGGQAGKTMAYANEAALAIAREVTRQQRQIVQELRTPVIVETPADRLARKQREAGDPLRADDGEAGADRAAGERPEAAASVGDPPPGARLAGDGGAAEDPAHRRPPSRVDVRV